MSLPISSDPSQHAVSVHGVGYVFDLVLTQILKAQLHLSLDMVKNGTRDANRAGLRETLQPGRYVNAIAVDIIAIDDHVAEVDADAKDDPPIFRDVGIAFAQAVLKCHGALHGIYHTRDPPKEPVLGREPIEE